MTFPDEEDHIRRKKLAEFAKESMIVRSDDKEANDGKNTRFVAATHFKKKMAVEVKNIIEDRSAAEVFLKSIAQKKIDRKKRNMRAMILNSTNPEKQEVDFIKVNSVEFQEYQAQKKRK